MLSCFSYAWTLQDILGVVFCINILKTIRLKSLKVKSEFFVCFQELPASDSCAVNDMIRYTMVCSLELFEQSLTRCCMVLIYLEPFRNRQTHKEHLPWMQTPQGKLSHLTLLTFMLIHLFQQAAIFDCVWELSVITQ